MKRRELLKLAALAAAGSAFANGAEKNEPQKKQSVKFNFAPLPKNGKGKRVVIIGGGWAGLSVAKRLKKYSPDTDVVLIEQRAHFVSCPISNLWLVDAVDLEFLTHSYLDAANNNGYTFFQAAASNIDKKNKVVITTNGDVKYDYLVVATGIDYDYGEWTKGDIELEYALRTKYPPGFMSHSEHQVIKEKLEDFEEGNFILTVPGGNYRCLPAPYERACLIADYFKKNKIKGKVVLLDENPDITIKKKGFHSAFKELYKDYIQYVPSAKIDSFDLKNKKVETEVGDVFEFADAAFYPRVRGSKLLEIAGIAKDGVNKLEANIDPFTYQVKDDPNIFCCGDVRPMRFSKSGNTANSEGYVVARIIADLIAGKKPSWKSPHTTCYSAVAADPVRAISVDADYKWDKKNKFFTFANPKLNENWHVKTGVQTGKGLMEWGRGMYRDMFE